MKDRWQFNRQSCIEIRLMGGLGNQLFILIFATLLARTRPSQLVRLEVSEIYKQLHKSSIFNLALDEFLGPWPCNLQVFLSNSRVLPFRDFVEVHLCNHAFLSIEEIGYSLSVRDVLEVSPRVLRGYFQTYIFKDELSLLGSPLNIVPKVQSEEFRQLSELFSREDIGVVHIRRGDYMGNRETIGVLDMKYFITGVRLLEDKGIKQFYVASDDQDIYSLMKESIDKASLLTFPKSLSDEETISLMSSSRGIVLSNSTFSYWAAYSGIPKQIVRPTKWFRNLTDPNFLFPPLSRFESEIESVWY